MFDVPRKWTTALQGGVAGVIVGLVGTEMMGAAEGVRFVFPFAVGAALFYGLVGVITAAIIRSRLLGPPLDSHPVTFCMCLGAVYAPLVAGALILIAGVPAGIWFYWQARPPLAGAGWLLAPMGAILLAEPLAVGCGAALGVWVGLRTRPWNHDRGDWVARARRFES